MELIKKVVFWFIRKNTYISNCKWEHGLTQIRIKRMSYYETWRQERQGPVLGKVCIVFTVMRDPVKTVEERKLTRGEKQVRRL